jgi:hypothetical protein
MFAKFKEPSSPKQHLVLNQFMDKKFAVAVAVLELTL